jgi:formate dehydrogenase subunit delta
VSAGKIDKLVRMANQIGDFFAPMPKGEAALGVATHLRRYWTPKMIRELIEAIDGGRTDLNATAARGVSALRPEPRGSPASDE